MSKQYNNKFRKVLFEKINDLSITEHEEIFKIIHSHKVTFTQNKNGVFFNITDIDDHIIEEMDKFIKYCIGNKTILDEYDKKLNECKINNNFETIMPQGNGGCDEYVPGLMEHSIKTKEEEWSCASNLDIKKLHKITTFVEKMSTDRDKIGKKKMNVKFHNARKKYSKKICKLGDEFTTDNFELQKDEI